MRAGHGYDCSRCGLEGANREEVCEPRCRHARDENDRRPPLPSSLLLTAYLPRSIFRLTTDIAEMRARHRWRSWMAEVGDPVPIALNDDGYVSVRGTVELLEPAKGYSEDAAVIRSATLERSYGLLSRTGKPQTGSVDNVRIRRAAGRFLVRDETGIALIDDDWLELVGPELRRPSPGLLGTLTLYDGDPVTVLGNARRAPLPGIETPDTGGYRKAPTALCFDGDDARPLLVLTDSEVVAG